MQQVTSTSVNGGIHAEPKVGNRDRERTRIEAAESERESLLNTTQQDATPKVLKHKQLYTCINEQQQLQHPCGGGGTGSGGLGVGAAGGCESDTNSNCALLVEESNAAMMASSGAGAATKTINGNNNYELSEFDDKAHTYR